MMTFPQFFGSRATFRLFGSCAWVVFFLLALAPPGHAAGLTPGPPQTVTETRIQRTVFEYVMQISVTNSDTKTARGVIATVTSTSPRTTIVEGSVTFGSIAPGLAAAGADTFTLRHDRTVPFDPAVLQWTFVKVPADPTVAAPSSPTMLTSATVAGTTDAGASIEIVGGAQTITGTAHATTGVFNLSVPLQANRLNPLFVTAFNPAGRSAPVPVAVLQDAQPPTLFLDFPENGAQLTTDTIVVGGRVGDMLSGYQGLTVSVNGQSATVNVGIGNNGNTVSIPSITVHRVPLTGPRMTALSGDMQNAPMHARLAQPLVVKMTNADGTPFAGKLVTFTVTRSDGRLAADPAQTAPGTLLLQIPTDASGLAKAWWNVGADAGRANNRVTVTSKDIAGTVAFCASADPGPVHQINIGTGHNQKAEAGGPAPEPLRAWASDMCNGINNLPITFTIKQGGGKVNGADSTTVNTGITGHAQATLTLGPDADTNVIEANYPGNPNLPATFIAYGVTRDPTKPTTFTGLILDNTSNPIGGATCKLVVSGQTFTTTSDPQGRFAFGPTSVPSVPSVPSGPAHLFVDGLTATQLNGAAVPPGTYPPLGYVTTIIPNAENSLPTPVLLPCMNVNNAKTYNGTTDLILTCEGIAGLKMTIKAGSMRKPDGSLVTPTNTAVVSLNQVHHDQIPMPMPDGASPPFAWTLQPGGAHFDPPIAIEYPNMSGLPAGAIAYFLSFNHDTERFEIVASGHVSPDGSTILTDPGAGLTIAGWGCNCPPYSVTGELENCVESCLIKGALTGGSVTVSARSSCINQPLTFRIESVADSGRIVQKVCRKSGTTSRVVSGATPTYGWRVTRDGQPTVFSGSGSSASFTPQDEGQYVCQFLASVTRECAPPTLLVNSETIKVSKCDMTFASADTNGVFRPPYNDPEKIAGDDDFHFLVGNGLAITVKFSDIVSPLTWEAVSPTLPLNPSSGSVVNGQFSFTPDATAQNRPIHNDAADAVTFTVRIKDVQGHVIAEETVAQDLKDSVRQEYIDFALNLPLTIPRRSGRFCLNFRQPPLCLFMLKIGIMILFGTRVGLLWRTHSGG